MQLFENISMAFASVRSNKMRSLLTMLGIIIGIAAVIAIVTVGNSMTGSVTDSMSGMGVSNITVTVKQKTSGDTQGTAQGVTLRRFMDETPGESDRITDAMIHDFYAAFPDKVDHFEYTVDVGQETISKYGDPTTTIKASVSGVNHDTLANKDEVFQKREKAAKQAAYNSMNGKSHLQSTPPGPDTDDVRIPAETLRTYRAWFPDWSDKKIREHYKKSRSDV